MAWYFLFKTINHHPRSHNERDLVLKPTLPSIKWISRELYFTCQTNWNKRVLIFLRLSITKSPGFLGQPWQKREGEVFSPLQFNLFSSFDKLPHTHSTSEEQSAHSLHSTPNCNVFIQKSMRQFLFRFPILNTGLTPSNLDSLSQGSVCWFWHWEPTWVKAGFDFYIWNESKIQQKDVILLT